MEKIQAVILAAGEGNRLRPLTKNRPKVMLPLVNKPILGYVLDAVLSCGIRDITVVVGYQKEQVMSFLNSYQLDINVVTQKTQLGTAHALLAAEPYIHTKTLVLPGDDIIDPASIRQMMARENAVLVAHHNEPSNFGVVSQRDGLLTQIIEKPSHVEPGALVSCGVYVFEPELIRGIQVNALPELLKNLIQEGKEIYAVSAGGWHDAVFPWDLLPLNEHLLPKEGSVLAGTIDKTASISGRVSVGKNTIIGPNTVITGPAVIGDNCRIGANVCIGLGTSLGPGVIIEPFCYLERCIIMQNSSIGSHSRLVDSVVGEGCVFSDHLATVSGIGECRPSETFGGVFGDFSRVGPFTIIKSACVGNNVVIAGGKTIDKDIPDDSRVI